MSFPSRFIEFIAGESVRDRICRIVRGCEGMSLANRRQELEALVGRGVDEPAWASQVARWMTNCGTSALGVLASACGSVEAARAVHPLLATRSVNGMSIAWLMRIGYDTGAWTAYKGEQGPKPRPGDLLRYGTPGKNDDHVEWLLSPIDAKGEAEHGGGGRANNAITIAKGPVLTSSGRPLLGFWNVDALEIPESPPLESEAPAEEPAPVAVVPAPEIAPEASPAPPPEGAPTADPPPPSPPSPLPPSVSTSAQASGGSSKKALPLVIAGVAAALAGIGTAFAHCGG